MPDHEVVIVGGGPVGLLLACLLVQEGVDAVVCERRTDADPRTRAIGIHRPGLDALDAAGLGETVRVEALRLDGGDVRSRGRTLASLTFADDRPVLILPQPRTHALLRSRLHALAPEALRAGCRVEDVGEDADAVRVRILSGQGREELTASVVVVADGVRSSLRHGLGFGWRRHRGSGSYAMVDVPDAAGGDRAALHCGPDGLVESFPLPGGWLRWVVKTDAGGAVSTAAGFRDTVEARTGIAPLIDDDVVPSMFSVAQHTVDRAVRGRIAMLGDAAHELSPIGGQGMNLGWMDAARLAPEIHRALTGGRPLELSAWASRVRRSARAAQRRSAFYMSMGTPAPAPVAGAREVLVRALGAPVLRERMADVITMRGL